MAWRQYPVKQWQSNWLFKIDNVEHRMLLIRALGYDKIMRDLGTELIHSQVDQNNNKMEMRKVAAEIENEPVLLLKVVDPSSSKIYILRVPPDMTTCEQARRWTLYDESLTINFIQET